MTTNCLLCVSKALSLCGVVSVGKDCFYHIRANYALHSVLELPLCKCNLTSARLFINRCVPFELMPYITCAEGDISVRNINSITRRSSHHSSDPRTSRHDILHFSLSTDITLAGDGLVDNRIDLLCIGFECIFFTRR